MGQAHPGVTERRVVHTHRLAAIEPVRPAPPVPPRQSPQPLRGRGVTGHVPLLIRPAPLRTIRLPTLTPARWRPPTRPGPDGTGPDQQHRRSRAPQGLQQATPASQPKRHCQPGTTRRSLIPVEAAGNRAATDKTTWALDRGPLVRRPSTDDDARTQPVRARTSNRLPARALAASRLAHTAVARIRNSVRAASRCPQRNRIRHSTRREPITELCTRRLSDAVVASAVFVTVPTAMFAAAMGGTALAPIVKLATGVIPASP